MEATMEAVGLMLVGVAIGAVLASVWHRQWLADGIWVRDEAADHLEQSRAHLARAAGYIQAMQAKGTREFEAASRSGAISYPGHMVYVDEVRPGESIWEAAERERREKLAKNADLGANPGKTVLEDARGDVFGAGRRGEDGAKPASGGDPWFGWTGPPDPPVRLGAGTYPTGLAVDPTPWCPECRAFHPANQTGMLEQCAACMEAMPHLGTRCQECGAEWGEFCRPGCATRLKHTGVAVERKLRQGRGSAGAPIWDAAERVEAAELVASDDWGFIGPKYATLEEVEAVHGPVVETFEPRCSYCGENHGLECPRPLCIDCRAPRSHHSGRNCTADPPIFEDSVRRAYKAAFASAMTEAWNRIQRALEALDDAERSADLEWGERAGIPMPPEPQVSADLLVKLAQYLSDHDDGQLEPPFTEHDISTLGKWLRWQVEYTDVRFR